MENKKTEDCHFFLSGYCNKGDGCEFRHLVGVNDQPFCVQWLLGTCDDPNCPNRHPTLPRQKDGSRTLCFYNQGCTRPDCPFLHTGTIASPATPRSDKETPLVADLTPRDGAKAAAATGTTSLVIPPKATPTLSGPTKPRKRPVALLDLPPRSGQVASGPAAGGGGKGGAASKQSFVKSLDEILKEKEEQVKGGVKAPETKKPQTEAATNAGSPNSSLNKRAPPVQQQASATKARPATSGRPQVPQMNAQRMSSNEQERKADGRRRPASSAPPQKNSGSPTAPAARPSFGVKSLDELLQDRGGAAGQTGEQDNKQQKQATASAAGAKGRTQTTTTTPATGVKRPREESVTTTKALQQPQQKQPRAEPASAAPQQQQKTQEEEEDDDFERELEEIGIDDINGTDDTPLDDDDLSELLAE